MKVKEGFVLRKVATTYAVVATGKRVKEFNGVITLNETGAFLWKILEKGASKDELVSALLSEYEVAKDVAEKDVSAFVEKVVSAIIVE